ncbi:glycosyltransferase family 4 protein [Saccharicrinis aurantiacus]|uniref:glycosyltransferase family 4 protein n=1 Tax=Saccharicrinis aurantiacus TaxID=1849719 RepID=UPI00094F5BD6|nr:glycosyltransferase family 4 protein [Saccharicrinis aurantiacus]
MKIAFIGTYPPRECGIGAFTHDLYNSIVNNNKKSEFTNEGFVVAMNDYTNTYKYPKEVKQIIRQERQEDYLQAAKFINHSGADACVLEHEFGIFGGQSGVYILPLLHRLEIPLVVTLHTILETPSYNERAILAAICKMAQKIVVMSHKAIDFLTSIYDVTAEKIEFIDHGVPDIKFNAKQSKKELKLDNKRMLMTFGFVGRNKGIETVIKALPAIIKKHANVVYMVLGKTHPNILKYSGEEYRIYLMRLIKSLHLEEHVVFINEFLDVNDLFKYLAAADIYITPYTNKAQITSGTLSYAVGVGSAVISTPYWHAEELLANGRGKLFDFNDAEALAIQANDLFDHPSELKLLKSKASEYGKSITWPLTGIKYINLLQLAIKNNTGKVEKKDTILDLLIMPPFSLAHINRLTDDTGIIQHAKFGIPNLKEGYCLDDNARALLMALMSYRQIKDEQALELCPIYLSYIHYMQNNDGTFRNFLSFNRNYLDEVGSEDSFGRTIWALGYLMANAPNDAYYQTGREIFFNAAPHFDKLTAIRSIANTIIGLCYYLETNPGDDALIERLRAMTQKLMMHYKQNKSKNWDWFEPLLTYDNGILPLSLFHASKYLNDDSVLEVAISSMDFLTSHTLTESYLSVIGNEKWYKKDEHRSVYAQQPVDAMAMVLMYHQAYLVTKNKEYLNKLYTSFLWFLGENDLRMSLYDFETNGCCDGFESYGVNRNQGAESSLAYLISHLTVLQAYEEFHKHDESISYIKKTSFETTDA